MRIQSVLVLAVLGSVACSDLLSLKQSNPGQIDASTLYVPSNAQIIVNGAIADFECSYSRYVLGSGILSDEVAAAIANSANFNYDRRLIVPTDPYAGGCGGVQQPGFYTAFSTARADADTAHARFEEWTDAQVTDRVKLMAQLSTYAGYSILMLGEAMCSAAINVGPELTSAQLFQEAKLRFDRAITEATTANDATTLNLARLGRARTLLNLGDLTAAAADAALIPANFLVSVSADATNTRRQNSVFIHITQSFFGTVDPSFRNVTLENGQPDPRVAVTNSGRTGSAANTPIWTPNKYPAANSTTPLAKYAEAQLIIAEARIAAGDLAGAATAINNARNSGGRTGMPTFSATGLTAAQVKTQLIEERRREFFLEGHRLYDIRRYSLPLNPPAGAAYTVGGGVYADATCFPLPAVERSNNPNIPKP
jgi:hypothetical protein